MVRKLKYFKYEGEPISQEQLENIEFQLTEVLDKLSKQYDVLYKRDVEIWDIVYPDKGTNERGFMIPRPPDNEMYEKYREEKESVRKNLIRISYDIESLKQTRGILRRYKNLYYY
jgi:hypothetical protein